jgi:hypothetical protein
LGSAENFSSIGEPANGLSEPIRQFVTAAPAGFVASVIAVKQP